MLWRLNSKFSFWFINERWSTLSPKRKLPQVSMSENGWESDMAVTHNFTCLKNGEYLVITSNLQQESPNWLSQWQIRWPHQKKTKLVTSILKRVFFSTYVFLGFFSSKTQRLDLNPLHAMSRDHDFWEVFVYIPWSWSSTANYDHEKS